MSIRTKKCYAASTKPAELISTILTKMLFLIVGFYLATSYFTPSLIYLSELTALPIRPSLSTLMLTGIKNL